ncbi:MAG TPA: hypothetical protein VLE03_09395 [Nitrospiraceae bacterium]|nr:hypothetical protein [Nitrospiraceae bacterium]
MTQALMTSPLTADLIQEVIAGLPIQGRIMLRLLLIQHFDVTHDEILFMVSDRPDPRCVSGKKPITTMTQESISAMISRRDEYRRRARLRRERTWLQCNVLKKQAETAEGLAERAAALLAERGVSAETIGNLKAQARTAVPRPALRVLDERWEADEISAEEYQKHRLAIEMQTQLRFAERFRKRLDLAERERQTSDQTVLLDHEIGHIWGIPAGTLAARKVKFLSQYLMALQAKLSGIPSVPNSIPPLDLWKETLAVLSHTPIERSITTYDGLEQTEQALIDKLTAYVAIGVPEAIEVKFWNSLVYGASSNAMHAESTRTLFGLQRLAAIQNDFDGSPEALEEELLKRTAPTPKASAAELTGPAEAAKPELTDLQKQILHNFIGEDVSGRASDKW